MKAFIVMFSLFIVGCKENERDLSNGLRLVEVSKGNSAIIDARGGLVVYPNVRDVKLARGLIMGRREMPEDNSNNSPEFNDGIGYFILNPSTGALIQGLQSPKPATIPTRQVR